MMAQVFNKREKMVPAGAVYVGRPTVWGNPFSHLDGTTAAYRVASREVAVARFAEWLESQPTLVARARRELRGRDLVCWCAPLACHADVLLRVANDSKACDHDGPFGR